MSKSAGHVVAMSLNITQPTKFDIPKMEFNQIVFLVGPNGSGKTLILKLNWCFTMLANYFPVQRITGATIDFKKEFQFIMDKSFDDNNFDGVIETFFENATIKVEFKEGQVTNIEYSSDEDLIPSSLPIFMSKETRSFESFVKYMKMKKALGVTETYESFKHDDLIKLTDVYKLYDVLFIEMMLSKMNGYTLTEEVKKALDEMFSLKLNIDQIIVDNEECELYGVNLETNEKQKLTRLSAGEQSILNMILASYINK